MVEPYNLASAKTLLKHLLYLILSHRLIAMGSHKANARCENSSPTVALYRATLEHKVVIIHTLTLEHALMEQCAVDKIVLVGSKLLAPSIETEVEQAAWSRDIRRRNKRKEGMVACPSVVVVALVYAHTAHLLIAQAVLKLLAHTLGIFGGNDKRLVLSHSLCYLNECLGDVVEIRTPIGGLVWPSELHTSLAMPFGRKNVFAGCHKCICVR